ncbi:MAG: Flp family type IVb pilin [Rhodospirillales bacterium]|nr:Flp family type IVb pilin [Rhodospirillales bacterium]
MRRIGAFLAEQWHALRYQRRGVTAMEYGVLTAIVIAAMVTAFDLMGHGLSAEFTNISGLL